MVTPFDRFERTRSPFFLHESAPPHVSLFDADRYTQANGPLPMCRLVIEDLKAVIAEASKNAFAPQKRSTT